ncbi:MAG: hypothetical protein P1U85_12130 [Verrucomicrobiales bacterium]|nr:hypothetical protein [Verrucomicrobiales bacterium]
MVSVRLFGFFLSVFFISFTASSAISQDLTTRPSPESGPTIVTVRMVVLNIDQIKGADQSYVADIAFRADWQDDRLRHEGSTTKRVDLSDIWHPGFQILNQLKLTFTFANDAEVSPDGSVRIIQRAWGSYSQPLELVDFPFDTQALKITLVSPGHEKGTVALRENVEEPSRIADSFSIPDWDTVSWSSKATEREIFEGEQVLPTFEATIVMKRNSRYYFINVILPLFLIICMSWIVFWIPSTEMGPRISVSVTAMLTLTAYRFAIGASLPKIAYLTRLDWFILGSSFLVFISLLEVVITSKLARSEKKSAARKLNVAMRYAAPITFLLISYLSLFR